MKTKINCLFLIIVYFVSYPAFAQEGRTLTGKVQNQSGQPLAGANISLRNSIDSVKVFAAFSNEQGLYQFIGVQKGRHQLQIDMLGYDRLTLSINLDTVRAGLPLTTLLESNLDLKEVKILARKNLVEHKIDRTIINVEAMRTAAGSTAFEVLEKSPGITKGQQGELNLKGRTASVFIDGKPSYLSGADLENYLRSLPASALNQIELMTNPPAKYDAAGNGGVINIRLKKDKLAGFNGAATFAYIQGKYGRSNSSFNFNYRKDKFNLSANTSYISTNSYSDLDINRHFENAAGVPVTHFLQRSFTRHSGRNLSSRIDLDYDISDRTAIGMSLNGVYRTDDQSAVVGSQFSNAQFELDSVIRANNLESASFKNGSVNFNFRHDFKKKGRSLNADIDYLNYQTGRNQTFINATYLANENPSASEILSGTLPTNIGIYAFKSDYEQELGSGITLNAGLKSSIILTDNEGNYFNTIAGVAIPDYEKTNHFNYHEQISAAYFNAGKSFDRLTLQLGLRFENTFSKGQQLGNIQKPDSVFKKNYRSLFPTAYLQYKADSSGNHLLSINCGRRINRPYYQDLNPFLSPIDKFTYYTGNPFLRPAYSNNMEFSHSYKGKLTTTLTYSKTSDEVNETIEILNGIYYSRPGNIGQSVFTSLSLEGNIDLASWANLNVYGQLSNIHSYGVFYEGYLDTKGTFIYLSPSFTLKTKNDWAFQLDGYYQSRVTNAQFVAGRQKRLNAAMSKKLSTSTSIKLVLNDVFHAYVNSGRINNLWQTRADYRNISDTRNLVLNLNYKFGQLRSNTRKHDAGAADTEKDRVKD